MAEYRKSYTFASAIRWNGAENAEIAQLVEHNLAKVGVASSSLVFRSRLLNVAQVAELVDAHVSGACVARRAGSSPVLGTEAWGGTPRYVGEVAELVDALV